MAPSVQRLVLVGVLAQLALGLGGLGLVSLRAPDPQGLTATAPGVPEPLGPPPPLAVLPREVVAVTPPVVASRAEVRRELPPVRPLELVPGHLPGPSPFVEEEHEVALLGDTGGTAPAGAPPLLGDHVVVRVSSDPPGAAVLWNGRRRGKTPAKLMVSPGRHALVVVWEGRRTAVRQSFDSSTHLCFTLGKRRFEPTSCGS